MRRHAPAIQAVSAAIVALLTGALYFNACQQSGIARDAARAARDQADVSKRQLTAVMSVTGLDGPATITSKRSETFAVRVRNNGGGAALNVRWTGELLTVLRKTPCSPIRTAMLSPRGADNIGGGQERALPVGPWFSDREVKLVNSGKATVVVKGVLRYMDLFQGSHAPEFCYWLSGPKYFPCIELCPSKGY
jgi:hypothetical protein